MLPDLNQLFSDRAPWHGFGTDDLQYGVKFYEKIELLTKSIVQYNQRHSIGWLVFDCDSPTSLFDWEDNLSPPPNLIAMNPANGHAHLFYALEKPVHNHNHASIKALRYTAAIQAALRDELHADPGFTDFLCKNPINPRWEVFQRRLLLWTLDELADWLDLGKYSDRRRRLPDLGYGRNVNLFHALRMWAYRERRKAQTYLSEDMFRAAVLNHAYGINGEFEPPLPHSEVRSTAKSVSRWTWLNMSLEGFKKWQKGMSIAGNKAKSAKAMQLHQQILETARDCPDINQTDIAALCGCSQQAVSYHLRLYQFPISDRGPKRRAL